MTIILLIFVSTKTTRDMEKKTYHATESYYSDMLSKVRYEILGQITAALDWLGGKVCLAYYHNEEDLEGNTFFEVDDDGYGRELFIDTVERTDSGEIEIRLSDSEDCYCPVWDLSDLAATDSLYLLSELEDVIEHVQDTKEEVVKEYDYE